MTVTTFESVLRRDRLVVAASLVGVFVVSWIYLFYLAAGMETMDGLAGRMMGMPGPPLTRFAWVDQGITFVLVTVMWIVMMVGMMLPSAAQTILLFAAIERKRKAPQRPFGRTALLASGYFIVWSVFSVVVAALQLWLSNVGLLSMDMATTSAVLGGAVFVLAGLYELSPLKDRCLTHCRTPLAWITRGWREGGLGALAMGAEHGVFCVGCCWVLMLLLFAVGAMNLLWVAILAAIVLAQKLLPGGQLMARIVGAALIAWGTVLIARPLLMA